MSTSTSSTPRITTLFMSTERNLVPVRYACVDEVSHAVTVANNPDGERPERCLAC